MSIITDNIRLMRSGDEGGMQYAAARRAYAGECNGIPSAVIDFFYDDAGKMISFPHNTIPPAMREFNRYFLIIAKLGADAPGRKTRIVNFTPPADASDAAKRTLEQTIEEYNAQHSFQPNPSSSAE